jgi:nucleotide-binding universal stress UspA family protein
MYRSILVPTDGSEGSETAAEHAVDIAGRYDATLHAQYVIESTQASELLDDDERSDLLGHLEEAGREAVDAVADRAAAAGIECAGTVVERGVPHESILDYVTRNDVDLVVMATSGRTGESRELMGSVTEKVVRASPAPVLTINVGETA